MVAAVMDEIIAGRVAGLAEMLAGGVERIAGEVDAIVLGWHERFLSHDCGSVVRDERVARAKLDAAEFRGAQTAGLL